MGPTSNEPSPEECRKILRRMELETYSAVVSTLRAQGELNKDRRKLLEDLASLMKISPERHKAEIRRAVNDERLASIADRMSGGVDTEWGWALEGRRVVPLMPRLVRPTPFTALATTVSKIVQQNPRICLSQSSNCLNNADMTPVPSKYVRDPDDEDTLSPVMVPIASPDTSSCHSNNNFESDYSDMMSNDHQDVTRGKGPVAESHHQQHQQQHQQPLVTKKPVVHHHQVHPTPVKRPRSPSGQVVNVSTPMGTKIRALSPSCIRPQQSQQANKVQAVQLAPRAQGTAPPIRPAVSASPHHVGNHKIRVRAPVLLQQGAVGPVQMTQQRPVVGAARPVAAPQPSQVNSAGRPVVNNNNNNNGTVPVKQVVQIRAAPALIQQQPQPQQQAAKVVQVQQQQPILTTHKVVQQQQQLVTATAAQQTVVTTSAVPPTLAKGLPAKANVIVLHKNSPMAKTITTAAREGGDRAGLLNKANFLPKAVSTPTTTVGGATGSKVAFPGNVRIISVPSVSSASGAAHRLVSAAAGTTTQKNVYVLELTNDGAGKSILLPSGEAIPSSVVAELNGMAAAAAAANAGAPNSSQAPPPVKTATTTTPHLPPTPPVPPPPAPNATGKPNEILKTNDTSSGSTAEAGPPGQNGEQHNNTVAGTQVTILEHGLLDPQTGIIYTAPNRTEAEPTVDIFSTAIASADLNLEPAPGSFSNDDNDSGSGEVRMILTEAFDSPSSAPTTTTTS